MAPRVTWTLLGVPLRSTVTVLLAPAVCTAELGTVRVPDAWASTMDTDALWPGKSCCSVPVRPIVTG